MNSENFRKKNIISFILIIFLSAAGTALVGCGDDKVTAPPVDPGNTPIISGTITNYPGGSIIAKARVLKPVTQDSFFVGTDTVDNNGVLAMDLITPPTDFLAPFMLSGGIIVSDSSARATSFSNLRAYSLDAYIGNITYKNFDDSLVAGSFAIYYIFSTKPVTVTGADTNIFLLDTSVVTYNLNLPDGWSAFTLQLIEQRTNFNRYELRSGVTAGATWRYETVTMDRLINREFLRFH
jgi:hypothetical protein